MKLHCKVIEDLLPLYLDDICSEESREIVEEHLKECEACRKLIDNSQTIPLPDIQSEITAPEKIVKKGFKKIRLRWLISLVLVITMIPVSILTWNQINDTGIHFTNLYDYHIGHAFMKELHQGNYEKAYKYMNIDGKKRSWLQDFGEEKLVNLEKDGLAKFCELAADVEKLGGITSYEYIGIDRASYSDNEIPESYRMIFKVSFNDKIYMCEVHVSNDGVGFRAPGSLHTDPLARLSSWSEFLWQDYKGCYLDFDSNQYIYY